MQSCHKRIQLGRHLTSGLGAGAKPDIGMKYISFAYLEYVSIKLSFYQDEQHVRKH